VAVDGKAVRGSRTGEKTANDLLVAVLVLAVLVSGVSDAGRDGRTIAEFERSAEEVEAALLQAAHTYQHGLWKVRCREAFKCSRRSYFIRPQIRLARTVSSSSLPNWSMTPIRSSWTVQAETRRSQLAVAGCSARAGGLTRPRGHSGSR
jgi:hypothetical protein